MISETAPGWSAISWRTRSTGAGESGEAAGQRAHGLSAAGRHLPGQGQRFDAAIAIEQHPIAIHGVQLGAPGQHCRPCHRPLPSLRSRRRSQGPMLGSSPAMMPVSTSGMLVCGALAASTIRPRHRAGRTDAHWRWRRRSAAAAWRAERQVVRERAGAGASPPARSVTSSAACTPSSRARTQVAIFGPCASASSRQRAGAGRLSNQATAFMRHASYGPLTRALKQLFSLGKPRHSFEACVAVWRPL